MAIETVDTPYTGLLGEVSRTPKQQLGKDDFLLLLTEQLKNQDPLEPMDDMQFISQMSNFSSLEQMTNMNKTLEKFVNNFSGGDYRSEAMAYLGATITAQTSDMAEPVTGMVETVGFKDGKAYLKVGEYAFEIEDVQMASPTYINTEPDSSGETDTETDSETDTDSGNSEDETAET